MTQGTVQLVAGILAVVLIGIVILRRKNKKKEEKPGSSPLSQLPLRSVFMIV